MKKYFQYLKYVLRHKWFVFIECQRFGILWLGIIHDWSKFRPSEFIPYARYFYGKYPKWDLLSQTEKDKIGLCEEDIEMRFDKAWLYHIHRNKHHWQYWILREDDGPPKKLIPIPIKYLKEMICDWKGAGKAITGKDNLLEWYDKNKNNISLKIINRKWVEKRIGYALNSH